MQELTRSTIAIYMRLQNPAHVRNNIFNTRFIRRKFHESKRKPIFPARSPSKHIIPIYTRGLVRYRMCISLHFHDDQTCSIAEGPAERIPRLEDNRRTMPIEMRIRTRVQWLKLSFHPRLSSPRARFADLHLKLKSRSPTSA